MQINLIKEELNQMGIGNWGRVLFVIKDLNYLRSVSYFNFEKFCEAKGLDFVQISHFLDTANAIINGDSELVKLLKDEKRLVKQLEAIDRLEIAMI